MSEIRVKIIGDGDFNAREWLRRDALWASLMTPYTQQLAGWLDGSAPQKAQHDGNVSRQSLYAEGEDIESQAMAFFNQGKNIAGLISSAVLFRACMERKKEGAYINVTETQAMLVDRALSLDCDFIGSEISEDDIYAICARHARQATEAQPGQFGKNIRLLRASRAILSLASREAFGWVENSLQNEETTLPVLRIQNGGHPRSAGPRVNKLQPIFHKIVASPQYQSL
jgi:hypothetical protein